MRKYLAVATVCGLAVAGTAQAAQAPANARTADDVKRLMQCRAITAADQRLACFDRETAAIDQAIARKDLVVIDKEQAQAARRSAFGFSLPNFTKLFDGGGDDIKQVEGLVASATEDWQGRWTVQLQDGSVWSQTDSVVVPLNPRRGDKVVIKRGVVGNYFMKVGKQPGFRAKRIG